MKFKLNKKSRKTQKAIRRAVILGLPVVGLLATGGCERAEPPRRATEEGTIRDVGHLQGVVKPVDKPIGGEFTDRFK